MADVNTRVMLNSVTIRRGLYLKDNKWPSRIKQRKTSYCVNLQLAPNCLVGSFFEVLHSSAENLRDAKETQHLRDLKQRDLKRKSDDSRGSKASDKSTYST